MSITIVSTLPKPAQAKAAEGTASTSNDMPATGQDFASLLLGQLLPVVTEKPLEGTSETVSSETTTSQPDTSAADTSNLLAALGILPSEVKPAANVEVSSTSVSNTSDKTSPDKLTALQTQPFQSNQIASTASTNTVATNVVTAEPNDKAAKFAVPAAIFPTVENILPKNTPADPSTNAPPVISTMANGSLNALTASHGTTVAIQTPIREQNWANDFSQKVVWLATADKQSAQITLNPPQMGPIEISLSMDKGNATATFVSPNSEVRDAIETALPRLREMFASAGIELGQTNVSSESFNQQSGNGEGKSGAPKSTNDNAILVTNSTTSLPIQAFNTQRGNGLVNTFA
ncbi:MAG: flagellar hook-length control protein FliK [Betaproteobacteria bacterium]